MDRDENSSSKWKYHVFLSFRGEDTRLGFTDHLYAALERKCIITFRDDEELARGEIISQKLHDAIEDSLFAIVIISQNYASSTWCLDELQKIVDSKQRLGLEVFPIFYGVDPSDVRHQTGSFAEAFKKHEQKFVERKVKVQKWRDALKEVANLAGWESKNRHETKLIEEIIAQVWTKLEPKLPTYNDGLVAIETKVDNMYSHLRLGLQDVRFIGIWGMGGIGKTTLANVVFKRIKSKFDISCFLANVREASEGDQGLVHLQNKFLSHLKLNSMIIETSSQGKDNIINLLHNKKVLLVLDDVSAKSQLEYLAGNREWFGPGSRIIVTTRDKHLLTSHGVLFEIYEIKILNATESLQLFCKNAFKEDQPKEDYWKLSENIVEYVGGLPLALEVLGSLLCGRSVHEWKEALIKISQVPNGDILNKLKISYDMLEDEHKTIFLDIACFFKGWYKDKVTQILDNCGLYPTTGINVLIEKSLVTCDESVLEMHDLLEEMAKAIVLQESPNDPGRRSRLWSLHDIDQALNENMGTEKVQGIVLKSIPSCKVRCHPEAFSKMCNLRLLILYDLPLRLGLQYLSSSLKMLIWRGYPLKALPLGVQLDELVHLQMCNSKLENLWNGIDQFCRKLKVIDLSNSKDLIQCPSIYGIPNLEELFLDGCTKLVEVHQSVGQHEKLAVLQLIGCENLQILPSKMEMRSLKRLLLSGCSKIKRLPDFGENMKCVLELNLMNCQNLLYLPNTISNLKSLRILNISGCWKVYKLPDYIKENKALEDLDLSRTSIREVNPSLVLLENLKRLSFSGCSGPAYNPWESLPFRWKYRPLPAPPTYLILPRFISGLSSLTTLDLSYCNLSYTLIPEDLDHLSSLEKLILSGNEGHLVLPLASITNLSKLRCLEFSGEMLGSRTLLPPHARIYPNDFYMEASLIDQWKLWKLFESRDSELHESCDNELSESCESKFFGSSDDENEDCSWYSVSANSHNMDNQNSRNFIPAAKHDPNASIIVDIPNDCGLCELWGIAVFIAIDPPVSSERNFLRLQWSFDPPHPEVGPSSYLYTTTVANSNHYLLTMIMNDTYIYIQRHQRGSRNNDQSKSLFYHWKREFSENSKLRVKIEVNGEKVRDCRWHVLCKEDFRFEALPKSSTSEDSSSLNNCTIESEGEDTTYSNVQNEENSDKRMLVVDPSILVEENWFHI